MFFSLEKNSKKTQPTKTAFKTLQRNNVRKWLWYTLLDLWPEQRYSHE
jgi:hypothetical protein